MPTSTLKTAYAEEGAPIFTGRHAGQTATMLFSDVERKHWIACAHERLEEGQIVHLAGQFADFKVTWAKASAQREAA